MTTLEAIKTHGLSIRQIPLRVLHTYEMGHHKPGNEIIKVRAKFEAIGCTFEGYKKHIKHPEHFEIDDAKREIVRLYTREVTIPANAGHWMCKQVTNTFSRVQWSNKTDNLAPTLEESVALCIDKLVLAAINQTL